jgi:hypothetical protein
MRESSKNGRFLASRTATSLTDPASSQRLKLPLRNPHAAFSMVDGGILCNRPNCDAIRDHRS